MKSLKKLLCLLFFASPFVTIAQFIRIENRSEAELVQQVLIKSNCAQISEISASGLRSGAGGNSFAYFNAENTNFPIREGVVLATIQSSTTVGPYIDHSTVSGPRWNGDADLNQTIGLTSSLNATVLEFDFIPLTTSFSFNYIFASNEYNLNYPCRYSDAFAFLIKEKNSSENYKNIAVLPQSSTPVSSFNVHPSIPDQTQRGIFYPGCPAVNETYFDRFNTNTSPINYYGQTKKLTAQAEVIIGRTYHIKLVIAEDRDPYSDSAIFLEAGSFSAGIDLGPDRTLAGNNPVCAGETYTIDSQLPPSYNFKWYKNGELLDGETNPSLRVSDRGTYKVVVSLPPADCPAEDEIIIEFAPEFQLQNASLYQCDDNSDGLSVFDLSKADNILKNNDPSLRIQGYYQSMAQAQAQTNPIANPRNYRNTAPNEIVFARVSNAYGCVKYAQVILSISSFATVPPTSIQSCDTDAVADGLFLFNLNTQISPQLLVGLPSGLSLEYYLTAADAVSQTNPLPNLYRNSTALHQIIYARLANGPDCQAIIPLSLQISVFDPPNIGDEVQTICENNSKLLSVDPGYASYLWSNGATTHTSMVSSAGEYSVRITNSEGCERTKKFVLNSSGMASITNAITSDFGGIENSVRLEFTGAGDYQFSLDQSSYQDEPLFSGVNAGIYHARALDKNGCGLSAPYEVIVLDYPRFFTPNQDGTNDYWQIKNLSLLPKSSLHIFDRYGKLLKQLLDPSDYWNGTYSGERLPSDDYWFVLRIADGKELKGHFTLKR